MLPQVEQWRRKSKVCLVGSLIFYVRYATFFLQHQLECKGNCMITILYIEALTCPHHPPILFIMNIIVRKAKKTAIRRKIRLYALNPFFLFELLSEFSFDLFWIIFLSKVDLVLNFLELSKGVFFKVNPSERFLLISYKTTCIPSLDILLNIEMAG